MGVCSFTRGTHPSESSSLVNKKQSAVILGAWWGDEGSGKDRRASLGEKFDIVARYAGGHNAGHTVIIAGKKFVLQLIPCGVLRPECKGVIGNGVKGCSTPAAFLNEIKKLKRSPASPPTVPRRSSSSSPTARRLILPYHRMIELAAETAPGRQTIGTTRRGIGPAYEDTEIHRNGLRVCRPAELLAQIAHAHQQRLPREEHHRPRALRHRAPRSPADVRAEYSRYAEQVAPSSPTPASCSTKAIDEGQNVMFEGAQGALLDIDHGTYPFVTSSNCISCAGGAVTGTGVGPTRIGTVIGVTKAATSLRVGEGPFPTEISDSQGDQLRARGQ